MNSSSFFQTTLFHPWKSSFSKKKILFSAPFVFVFLLYAKLVFRLFYQASPIWWVFVYCVGFVVTAFSLSSLGLCLNQMYLKERKNHPFLYRQVLSGASSFFFDTKFLWAIVALSCLTTWILYACYFVLQLMPFLGSLISILCAVIPLAVSFLVLASAIGLIGFLFCVLPLHGKVGILTSEKIKEYVLYLPKQSWSFFACLGCALLSLGLGAVVTFLLLHISHFLLSTSTTLWSQVIQNICIIASCSLIMAPAFHLFFHYSMEAFLSSSPQNLDL